jgi:RHS repeat-associated protein
VGSIAAMTDASGALLEERAHYPFGGLRNLHRPGAGLSGTNHDFTGHERDRESGLVHMGTRSYLDLAGVFLSVDPRFVGVAALGDGDKADKKSFAAYLSNPQMGNLYAHALRSPLKYIDPDGLEPEFSKALKSDPVFKEALKLVKGTAEGKRILESVEKSGARVTVTEGRIFSKKGPEAAGRASIDPKTLRSRLTINMGDHLRKFKDRDARILAVAVTIHHELRHVEGEINVRRLKDVRAVLKVLDDFSKEHGLPKVESGPALKMGNEVHKDLDTYNSPSDDTFSNTFRDQAEALQSQQKSP